MPVRRRAKEPRELHRRRGVVDGAWADHHEQPVVRPRHDGGDVPPSPGDAERTGIVQGAFLLEDGGGEERPRRADAKVGGGRMHDGRSEIGAAIRR